MRAFVFQKPGDAGKGSYWFQFPILRVYTGDMISVFEAKKKKKNPLTKHLHIWKWSNGKCKAVPEQETFNKTKLLENLELGLKVDLLPSCNILLNT